MLTKPLGHFTRIPTVFLEALFRLHLNGTEWAIMMWTVRNTFGWNRDSTRFSWYRVAKTVATDRAAVYRTGKKLVAARLLVVVDGRLAVQTDSRLWNLTLFNRKSHSSATGHASAAP